MRSSIEERIDELIFNSFKDRKYDSKEAQKWCNDTSEVIIKLLQEINKDLKFTANMIILQKGDSGFCGRTFVSTTRDMRFKSRPVSISFSNYF